MMRLSRRGAQKALSPYAQALKHVALRGGVALQSSAKEMELEMYRAGTLPADYRPPAQGKWDDTIERWAYAWQYPVCESDGGDGEVVASVVQHRDGFARLLEFADRLIQSPPSTAPGSGVVASTRYPCLTRGGESFASTRLDEGKAAPSSSLLASLNKADTYADTNKDDVDRASADDMNSFQHAAINYRALEESLHELNPVCDVDANTTEKPPYSPHATHNTCSQTRTCVVHCDDGRAAQTHTEAADKPDEEVEQSHAAARSTPDESQSTEPQPSSETSSSLAEVPRSVMPVEAFSVHTRIPIAYLDDRSERSRASRELHDILQHVGLDYTEEGLIVAISALSSQHHGSAARAIFDFAKQVGLGPSAELYKALMRDSALRGDANEAMALIEEMKSSAITPRIGNWHELMRAFHHARDYSAVSHIVDNMKMYANLEPNEVTFALQLRALGKDKSQLNSLAEAVQLFDQMEHVYGYIAARPHYDALMHALSQSPVAEMRLRCVELAQKMNLMGMTWNDTTYLNLIKSAQVVGDVKAVERYLAQMREARLPIRTLHLSWAIQAHVQHLIRLDYDAMKAKWIDACGHGRTDGGNTKPDGSNSCPPAAGSGGYQGEEDGVTEMVNTWMHHHEVCFGIYDLVLRRKWDVQLPLLNALLRLCCQTTILCMEHVPDDAVYRRPNGVSMDKSALTFHYEEAANTLWRVRFEECGLTRDVYSYECYLALLAHQQRIDEAEKLFQEMVMQSDLVPSRRSYECLIFMHLSSGEEGGAARALHYLEAMERAQITVRASLLKKMVRVNNAAGYRRDMKRRARRIMQAREEYLARRAEGVSFEQSRGGHDLDEVAPGSSRNTQDESPANYTTFHNTTNDHNKNNSDSSRTTACDKDAMDIVTDSNVRAAAHDDDALSTCTEGVDADGHLLPQPLPLPPHSTLAWWEKWKRESVNKHELFDEESADGTPKGESFAEKNAALAKMGIESRFPTPSHVPQLSAQRLLPALRAAEGGDSAVSGSLWALDGGELSYPADGNGPNGWGVRLWRERAVLRKAYEASVQRSDSAAVPAFSSAGNSTRVVGDQVDQEMSQAASPGELSDWRRFETHRYDDTLRGKSAKEMEHPTPASAELVWRAEAGDGLAAYKSDAEVAMENDNTFYAALEGEAQSQTRAVVAALQNRQEDAVAVVGKGATRRSKYDYLAKWREMYRHGTLEVSEDPLLRFGRRVEQNHGFTMATSVRAWYERNKAAPATETQLQEWRSEVAQERERRASRAALSRGRRRSRRHK